MTTVLEEAKQKYDLEGQRVIRKVFEIKKQDTATSVVIQKLRWMAVRKRKAALIDELEPKRSRDEFNLRNLDRETLLLPRQGVSKILQTDSNPGGIIVSVNELPPEDDIPPMTIQSEIQSSPSSSNSTLSVIHYETEVRQAETTPQSILSSREHDSTNIFTINPDKKEDSFIISRIPKPEDSKKCINLSELEWRYVFIDRIEGTPFFYCFDMKDMQQFYCKVSNSCCAKLIEAYDRLKDHSNINQLHKVIALNKKTYLLFPRPQDDMLSYLRTKKLLLEGEAQFLFCQMCNIVRSCHSKGVVLRDLKLRKFVFDDVEKKHVQLESLVDAVVLKDPENDVIHEKRGCPLYVAPEVLRASLPYNGKAADMWSLGVILYTMLLGRYPFNDEDHSHLFMKITNGKFFIPTTVSPKARCLIRSLLQLEPQNRLTAVDVFYHPWIIATDHETYDGNKSDQCVPTIDFDPK